MALQLTQGSNIGSRESRTQAGEDGINVVVEMQEHLCKERRVERDHVLGGNYRGMYHS